MLNNETAREPQADLLSLLDEFLSSLDCFSSVKVIRARDALPNETRREVMSGAAREQRQESADDQQRQQRDSGC